MPHLPIPAPAARLILALVAVNVIVWILAAIPLAQHPRLLPSAVLSYVLGLRHALDADHISAIDLTTRRLIAAGQRPVAVGTFFSLGHSTVVVVTCVVVAASSGALLHSGGGRLFDEVRRWGGLVGTVVSATFLLLLSGGNAWVLRRQVRELKSMVREPEQTGYNDNGDNGASNGVDISGLQLQGEGFLAGIFRKLFRLVDRPWKMLPLGVLFGLGFDTSSEIAILGIASIQAVQGTSIWLILIFPMLFTAGMCLLDTADGALMMTLYTSKAFSRDRVAILYYSIILTAITVVVSAFVGAVQVLSLIQNVAEPGDNWFWDGLGIITDNFDVIGGAICGVFVVVGVGSVVVYGPWRRQMEQQQQQQRQQEEEEPLL